MYVDNYYVKILTENGIVGVTAFGMMLLGLVGNGLRACVAHGKDPLVAALRGHAVRPHRRADPQRV